MHTPRGGLYSGCASGSKPPGGKTAGKSRKAPPEDSPILLNAWKVKNAAPGREERAPETGRALPEITGSPQRNRQLIRNSADRQPTLNNRGSPARKCYAFTPALRRIAIMGHQFVKAD